jgi:hypothetical protein
VGEANEARTVVLLSEPYAAPSPAGERSSADHATACYTSVRDLVRAEPLASIRLLVVHAPRSPSGLLLVTLGRLNLEFPAMQKVAVLETPPPLRVAEYLTACGVDLVWPGYRRMAELASPAAHWAPAVRG